MSAGAASNARIPVAVFVSGGGSNLQALIEAARAPAYPAAIQLVLSDRADAYALTRAEQAGIEALCLPRGAYPDRAAFERALDEACRARGIVWIVLAGFMRVLGAEFVRAWHDRLINIHPSLLPCFKGLDTHARAIAAGVKLHGCTVHLVRPALDDGPIVAQAAVPVLPDDTPERLAARVLKQEHRLYPLSLAGLLDGRARLMNGGRVLWSSGEVSAGASPPWATLSPQCVEP